MIEWLAAAAILVGVITLMPSMLRRARRNRRASAGSGVWIAVGLAVSMIFDAKSSHAIEMIERKKDEQEDEESGDKSQV